MAPLCLAMRCCVNLCLVGEHIQTTRPQLSTTLLTAGVCVCTQLLLNCINTFESRAYVPLQVATVVGVGAYYTLIRADLYENRSDYKKMI